MATAWLLNLDADVELALPPGAAYTPSEKVNAFAASHVARLAAQLLGPADVLVDHSTPPGACAGMVGRAFCPTRSAVARLVRAGAEPAPAPSHEVLRRVNGRGFAASLGQTLPGAVFARTAEEVASVVREAPAVGRGWRLKRAHGMAGRGQRPVHAGELDAGARAFVAASLVHDGLQVEPNVQIVAEYAIHGWLAQSACELGRVVRQQCDASGQWQSSSREGVPAQVADVLLEEASRVGEALAGEGYFGPFGVDAFTYVSAGGEPTLQPRSEINARLSMAYVTGMGRVPP